MTLRAALNAAAQRFAKVSDTPRLDAELLMAHAQGLTRNEMLMRGAEGDAPAEFAPLIERRMAHEPIAYIVGWRDFWTIRLKVAPGVLIPRPDSETLLEAAAAMPIAPRRILDLGTGPGTLLLAALDQFPEATGLGIDASELALSLARENALALGLGSRAEFRTGDWAEGIDQRFDLILANPPYVESGANLAQQVREWEPHEALFAGEDGLDDYRRLIPQLGKLIAPGGLIAIEIGHDQAAAVQRLMAASGLTSEIRQDLGGRDRAVLHFALGKAVSSS